MKLKKKCAVSFGLFYQIVHRRSIISFVRSRADNEAIDIKWDVIDDDQEIEVNKPIERDPLGKKNTRKENLRSILLRYFSRT